MMNIIVWFQVFNEKLKDDALFFLMFFSQLESWNLQGRSDCENLTKPTLSWTKKSKIHQWHEKKKDKKMG